MFTQTDKDGARRFFFDLLYAYKLQQLLSNPGPTCDPRLFESKNCCDVHIAFALFWTKLTTRADYINELFQICGKPYFYQMGHARALQTIEGVTADYFSSCKTNVMSLPWYKALAEKSGVELPEEIAKLC